MPMLPQDMTIIEHGAGGGPEVMVPARAPLPVPKPDEVLIRVMATGVNRPDVQQRSGNYPPPPGASPIMGLECAGEVVATGESVTRYKPGDRVCALTNGGAYAEYCTAPEAQAANVRIYANSLAGREGYVTNEIVRAQIAVITRQQAKTDFAAQQAFCKVATQPQIDTLCTASGLSAGCGVCDNWR